MIHFKRLEIPNNANIATLRMKNCDDKHRKMFLYLTKKPNYLKKNKNKSITEKKQLHKNLENDKNIIL